MNLQNKSIVIAGAGFIGTELCKNLLQQAADVHVLSRNPEQAKKRLPEAVHVHHWNPDDIEQPPQLPENCYALIALLGTSVVQRWSHTTKQSIYSSRIDSTKTLLNALKQLPNKPELFLSASAIGFYGNRGDEVLTEDSTVGSGFLSTTCHDWEREIQQAQDYVNHLVTLRIGLVLSPKGGILKQMLIPFKLGLGGPLGNGQHWMSWIHMADMLGIILHALKNPQSGTWNATAPQPVRNKDFSKTLASRLHRPCFMPTPRFVINLLCGEMASMIFDSQKVLPNTTQSAGYSFQFEELGVALEHLLDK